MKRFWDKVDKSGDCWIWTAYCNRDGYGMFRWDGAMNHAHRYAYIEAHGEAPEDCILHTCDNPKCVNPDHLFAGTHLDNMQDKVKKGRQFCPLGTKNGRAVLTEEQVIAARSDPRPGSVIARELGVSSQMVNRIKRGNAWRI